MRPHAFALLLALAGCSGGEGSDGEGTGGSCRSAAAGGSSTGIPSVPDGSCPDFEPCGGNLDGRWIVREACVSRAREVTAGIVARCPTSAAAGIALDANGDYEFADGLLTVDLVVTATVTVAFTSACARSLCTDLESLCEEYGTTQAGDPQFSSTVCGVSDGECRCTLIGMPSNQGLITSYEVVDTQIVEGGGSRTDFCVNGGELSTSATHDGDVVFVGLDRE